MFKNKISFVTSLLLLSSSLAYGAIAGGGIAGSPHDLGTIANANVATNLASDVDNGAICVYCHTPHAANVAFDGAPLWNKKKTTGQTFTMYGESSDTAADGATIGLTTVPDNPASPSLACLSCHDGISGIDSIVNAPGSGMGALVDNDTNIVAALTNKYGGNIGGTPGTATTGTVIDLSNDHPISIAYDTTADGTKKGSLRATGDPLTDWVGADTVGDLLRNGNVECGSCHDPHNGTNDQALGGNVNFLRVGNAGSALCLGCHDK